MRINLGIDARPLSYGLTGNSRYLFEILKNLIQVGSSFNFFLYSNKPIHKIFLPFLENKTQIKIKSGIGFYWLNFILPGLLKKDHIELFWGTLQLLPYFKLNIPTVVNYHDLNFISAPKTMSKFNYIQHKMLSNRTLQNANTVFCLSQNTYNDIASYNPKVIDKLKVIYPGVTKGINIKNEPIIKEKYIFSIGTLEPRKNLKTIIDAYLLIKKDHQKFEYKLIIAGRLGWGENELTNQLKNNYYEKDGIQFIENPDEEILSNLYKYCSLFLFPSLHEGFGLPLLEALIEQKVCIASDIPIFKEILDPKIDILVNPKKSEEWKKSILYVIQNNKTLRPYLWNESEWTWKKTSEKIESELLKFKKLQ